MFRGTISLWRLPNLVITQSDFITKHFVDQTKKFVNQTKKIVNRTKHFVDMTNLMVFCFRGQEFGSAIVSVIVQQTCY